MRAAVADRRGKRRPHEVQGDDGNLTNARDFQFRFLRIAFAYREITGPGTSGIVGGYNMKTKHFLFCKHDFRM